MQVGNRALRLASSSTQRRPRFLRPPLRVIWLPEASFGEFFSILNEKLCILIKVKRTTQCLHSPNLGSAREGASGSVMTTTYETSSTSLPPVPCIGRIFISGSSWTRFFEILFPSMTSVAVDGQTTEKRTLGEKWTEAGMTSGIMFSAWRALVTLESGSAIFLEWENRKRVPSVELLERTVMTSFFPKLTETLPRNGTSQNLAKSHPGGCVEKNRLHLFPPST